MKSLLMCGVLAFALGSGSVHARVSPKGQPASVWQKMDRVIGQICSVGFGNGDYAFHRYDPKTYSRRQAKKMMTTSMRGWECRGVSFKTVAGAARVKAQLKGSLGIGEADPKDPAIVTLTRSIDQFQRLGVLQDVVYRGIQGGKAYGHTYFSIPHKVTFYLKTPTGNGKRLTTLLEYGD